MVDSQAPEKENFSKLYRWAEADAAFLHRISSSKKMMKNPTSSSSFITPATYFCNENASVDIINYSRQRYLRSYTLKYDNEGEGTSLFAKVKKLLKSKLRCRGKQMTRGHGKDSPKGDMLFKFIFCCRVNKVDVYDVDEDDDGSTTLAASPDLWIYRKEYI